MGLLPEIIDGKIVPDPSELPAEEAKIQIPYKSKRPAGSYATLRHKPKKKDNK